MHQHAWEKLENLSTDIYIALLILGGRHEELSSCSAKETSWSVPKKKKNSTQERERKEDTEQLSQSTITNQCLHTTKSLIH